MKLALVVVASLSLLLTACTTASSQTPEDTEVRNLILMIADGAGIGIWTAATYARPHLAVKAMPVLGLVDTRSGSHRVTDSAAGASAYATGERVTNRTISVGPAGACPQPSSQAPAAAWPDGCRPLETWFQIARDKGKATGIVTTTSVVDATPAAFVTASPSRYWYGPITEAFVAFGLDVMLGGGRRYFAPDEAAADPQPLASLCGRATCLATPADLAAYTPDDRPLVGLFARTDMDRLEMRPVELPRMVGAALARLERAPDGFVALFESEATDNAGHDNVPLARATADILEFDRAVAVALEFARRTPGTLLVVTADHETGGLSLVEDGTGFAPAYTTPGHTAGLVPLFAYGPGAERFGGLRRNDEIGGMLMEIVRGW